MEGQQEVLYNVHLTHSGVLVTVNLSAPAHNYRLTQVSLTHTGSLCASGLSPFSAVRDSPHHPSLPHLHRLIQHSLETPNEAHPPVGCHTHLHWFQLTWILDQNEIPRYNVHVHVYICGLNTCVPVCIFSCTCTCTCKCTYACVHLKSLSQTNKCPYKTPSSTTTSPLSLTELLQTGENYMYIVHVNVYMYIVAHTETAVHVQIQALYLPSHSQLGEFSRTTRLARSNYSNVTELQSDMMTHTEPQLVMYTYIVLFRHTVLCPKRLDCALFQSFVIFSVILQAIHTLNIPK